MIRQTSENAWFMPSWLTGLTGPQWAGLLTWRWGKMLGSIALFRQILVAGIEHWKLKGKIELFSSVYILHSHTGELNKDALFCKHWILTSATLLFTLPIKLN